MYPGNKRKKIWREEKERLLKMTLEERRKEYLRDYVPLKDIPTWMEEMKSKTQSDGLSQYLWILGQLHIPQLCLMGLNSDQSRSQSWHSTKSL